MQIYIPTLGRKHQETWGNLPRSIQERVIFVAPSSELTPPGTRILLQPPEISGIAATRQLIFKHAGAQPFVMLDDDLTFCTRREDAPTKFRPAEPEEIERMFLGIEDSLEGYAHVGVATREGGNRDTKPFAETTRLLRILAYNGQVLQEQSIRFDRIPVMEDFDVCLQLLRRGFPNLKLNWIAHDQGASNAAGGCSTYRTMDVQSAAARKLQELHPNFVTVVQKKTKTAWGGQERTDVRISWKQALLSFTSRVLDTGEGSNSDS